MRDEESQGVWCLRSYMKKDVREDFMIPAAMLLKKERDDLYIQWSHLSLSGSGFPVGSGWKAVREEQRDGLRAI